MPSGSLDFTADLPRKRMAAGLLLTDPNQRVLLVEPAYKACWEIPGGCVEVDESPYQAAAREGREELGLDLSPSRLLVVDWVPTREGRTEGVMFVYDGGTLGAAQAARTVVPPDELRAGPGPIRRRPRGGCRRCLPAGSPKPLMPEPTVPPVISKTASG